MGNGPLFHLSYSPGMTLRALESGFCSLPTPLLRTLRNSALLFAIRSHCLGEGGGLLRLLPSEHQKELKYSPVETFNTMGPFRLLFTVRGQVPNNRALPKSRVLMCWVPGPSASLCRVSIQRVVYKEPSTKKRI